MSLRNARFRHWMARLALAAILLMAALPTVGRLLESRAPAMHDTAMAMCTTDGLVMQAHDLLQSSGLAPDLRQALTEVQVAPCWTLMVAFPNAMQPGLAHPQSNRISTHRKPIRQFTHRDQNGCRVTQLVLATQRRQRQIFERQIG